MKWRNLPQFGVLALCVCADITGGAAIGLAVRDHSPWLAGWDCLMLAFTMAGTCIVVGAIQDTLKRRDAMGITAAITSGFAMAAGAQQLCYPVKPDPDVPNTLGWRCWSWDMVNRRLYSPQQRTLWSEPELRCAYWDESEACMGAAGIHARIVPLDWRSHIIPESPNQAGMAWLTTRDGALSAEVTVHGVVERFGKYVLGTEGWRCEWAVIRKLHAPTTEIGLQLEAAFPDVEISYPEEMDHGYRDNSRDRRSKSGDAERQTSGNAAPDAGPRAEA